MWYHKFEQMLEGAHKMEKLSRMQQRVYDYIAESIAEHGYAPSVREVGEANAAIFEMQKELLENQEYTDFIMKRILEENSTQNILFRHL